MIAKTEEKKHPKWFLEGIDDELCFYTSESDWLTTYGKYQTLDLIAEKNKRQ